MFLKKILKKAVGLILYLLFLDFWIYIFSKLLYGLSKLLFLKEWQYSLTGMPLFFKHQINFNVWRFNPAEWAFTLRGVKARELMFANCKVLDMCCGDGSYSYLFFSDIGSVVDAVDYDRSAIAYAKKYYKKSNVNYQEINIIEQSLPSSDYDVVVWNAGICYFTMEQIHLILKKIINSGKPDVKLCGMLPKANGHADHKTEFEHPADLKKIFDNYFNDINIKEIIEGNNANIVTFYFNASNPKPQTRLCKVI